MSGSATRVSPLRVGILILVTVGVIAGLVYFFRPVVNPPGEPGPTNFAGYVDVTTFPQYPFETPPGPAQLDVILAFVVADPEEPCEPSWGAFYSLDAAAEDLQLDRRIAQLRLAGGRVRVSFGGAINVELAASCRDVEALAAAYQAVIDRYDLRSIDFDVEGPVLSDAEGNARRAEAARILQEAAASNDRPLDIWLTLPVDTDGLTDEGRSVVSTMLAAGVDLSGVNGMTMNFGGSRPAGQSMGEAVIDSATALQAQVQSLYGVTGVRLDAASAWGKVGLTPMVGQNDVPGDVFTIADAQQVNEFARAQGVGLLSMWDLNRDGTCEYPLPVVTNVVQTTCSGVDQQGASFADVLATDTDEAAFITPTPSPDVPTPTPTRPGPDVIDDPATSPFPIWDPLGTYPAGSKVVWRQKVYEAKWWTSGFAPDTPVSSPGDTPWLLIGPVLPGDTPAPLPTLPPNTYAQWDPQQVYVAGDRVQLGLVPYEAKWWTQGQRPGEPVAGGSPWLLVIPGS